MPIKVVSRIPISIPPFIFFITRTDVMTSPIRASSPLPSVMFPIFTRVDSSFIIRPAFCIPTNVMKSPIPILMDCFMTAGMAFTIDSRRLLTVSSSSMIPSIRIAVRANCHECPVPRHIVNTKKALGPMPGAIPKGFFARKAISNVLIMATDAVAVNTEPFGIPSRLENRLGLTARIYDIVRNDVRPANISVVMSVDDGSKPNNLDRALVIVFGIDM